VVLYDFTMIIQFGFHLFSGGIFPSNGRGVRGRKKLDGASSVLGSFGAGTLSDLEIPEHESPPRTTEDTAESDTSSVASSLERLHEDSALFSEQWCESS